MGDIRSSWRRSRYERAHWAAADSGKEHSMFGSNARAHTPIARDLSRSIAILTWGFLISRL
jgi:hypothetical protein